MWMMGWKTTLRSSGETISQTACNGACVLAATGTSESRLDRVPSVLTNELSASLRRPPSPLRLQRKREQGYYESRKSGNGTAGVSPEQRRTLHSFHRCNFASPHLKEAVKA